MDADQSGAPGGMLSSQSQGGLDHVGELGLVGRSATIIGRDPLETTLTKPPNEPTDGRGRQTEQRGDVAGFPTLLPEPEHGLTNR
jgi:hypothetical protein